MTELAEGEGGGKGGHWSEGKLGVALQVFFQREQVCSTITYPFTKIVS